MKAYLLHIIKYIGQIVLACGALLMMGLIAKALWICLKFGWNILP